MFGIIRLIIWGAISIVCFLKIQKVHLPNKKRHVLSISAIILVLWGMSIIFPVENLFVNFSSPESAFNYANSEKVKLVIRGKETAFVIGQKDVAELVELIIPKSDRGWKLGRGLDTKIVKQKIANDVAVCIYQYKESKDYYVVVSDIKGEVLDISDNYKSEFFLLEEDVGVLNTINNTYYGYVHGLDEKYLLFVNGSVLSFKD